MAGIDYKPDYAAAGFSSMVNCHFPKHGDIDGIVYTWQAYADSIQAHPGWHPFNYLNNSYHRDADMDNMIDCATTLMLSPGVAQIFYGDETRRPLSDARLNVDSAQAFRSDMNWDSTDSMPLKHFRRLGNIRKSHPSIGMGRQATIDTHTCVRTLPVDTVVIRVKPIDGKPILLGDAFPDGTEVTELYTGSRAIVHRGRVSFPRYDNRIAIVAKRSGMDFVN